MTVRIHYDFGYTSIITDVIEARVYYAGGEKYLSYYSDVESYMNGDEPIQITLDDDTTVEITED